MKLILAFVFFCASAAQAEVNPDGWRFGLGIGMQSAFRSTVGIEMGSPDFVKDGWFGDMSVYLAANTKQTEAKNAQNLSDEVHTYKIMLESREPLFHKDIVSPYARIGVGYSVVEKTYHPDGGYVVVPIQVGADIAVSEGPDSLMTIFFQWGIEGNFLGRHTPARDFDGTEIMIGFRYFW